MEDDVAFSLRVESVRPADPPRRDGVVSFEFETEGLSTGSITLDVPFWNTSLDQGVKQAASHLATIAEALAAEARKLAE